MKKEVFKYVFVDLEMNQPSGKLIQIGACKYNPETGEVEKRFETFVNPEEPISQFITNLTGIADADVKDAPSAAQALESFWRWFKNAGTAKHLSGWGSDGWELIQMSKENGVIYPPIRYMNLKEMSKTFKTANNLSYKGGLAASLEAFGLQFVGVQHRAYDDALNAARLWGYLYSVVSGKIVTRSDP